MSQRIIPFIPHPTLIIKMLPSSGVMSEIFEAHRGQTVKLTCGEGLKPYALKADLKQVSKLGSELPAEDWSEDFIEIIAGEPGSYLIHFRLLDRAKESVYGGSFRLNIVE